MNNTITFAEFIIWASPIAFGVALFFAKDAYLNVKTELKSIKDYLYRVREDQAEQKVQIKMSIDSINAISKTIDVLKDAARTKANEVQDMSNNMRVVEKEMSEIKSGYGRILLVLNKVVTIIKPK